MTQIAWTMRSLRDQIKCGGIMPSCGKKLLIIFAGLWSWKSLAAIHKCQTLTALSLFKAPSMVPELQTKRIWNSYIELTWDEIPLAERNGIIQSYKIFYGTEKGPVNSRFKPYIFMSHTVFLYSVFPNVRTVFQLWVQVQKRGRLSWKTSTLTRCIKRLWWLAHLVGA